MPKRVLAETKFVFHGVGQGLFYSGEINLPKNGTLRFIYDCGSEDIRIINNSINRFKQDVEDNEIDLLIISHLHSDHISGLDELFNNFTIKEVILPYLYPKERILIALRRINMPTWYYDFLSDPAKYLFERGVKRTIVLGGEEGGEGKIPPEEVSPSPPEGEAPSKLDIGELPDDKKLKEKIMRHDKNWKSYIENNQLLVKNHSGYATALGLWLFIFFNYKITPSALQDFERCFVENGLEINDENTKSAIRDRRRLRDLKRCYTYLGRYLKNDFNNTSLVLYHGPAGRPKIKTSFLCFCPCCFYNPCVWLHRIFFRSIDSYFGQFLTGDIDFNMKYSELIRHYASYLKNISIAQVPHHGARKNWNSSIISNIPNCDFWIISAGFRNRYRHPSYKVIEDVCLKGKECFWINEISHIRIRGETIW